MREDLRTLLDGAVGGSQRDLARLISAVENRADGVLDVLDRVQELAVAPAHVLGVTGPPGAGKSTLVDGLLDRLRARGERVAVLLVDPSSPFSGGAVLGDRIRMQRHTADEGVFIRSLGSRGHQGGLTRSTDHVLQLVRAAGFDRVVLETVGVGQTELQVMDLADTVLVLLVPEAGDSVQAMKAGLMEIADLFAVNKADRPGADRLVMELEQAVRQTAGPRRGPADDPWSVPVSAVSATTDRGIDELVGDIERHRTYRATHPVPPPDPRVRLTGLIEDEVRSRTAGALAAPAGALGEILVSLENGEISAYGAASSILDDPDLLAAALGLDGQATADD